LGLRPASRLRLRLRLPLPVSGFRFPVSGAVADAESVGVAPGFEDAERVQAGASESLGVGVAGVEIIGPVSGV